MSFCPECGKAVTPDDAVCESCGHTIRSEVKKARGGRFLGTMMMSAPVELDQQEPANVNAQQPAARVDAVAKAGGIATGRSSMPAPNHNSYPASAKRTSNRPPSVRPPSVAPTGRG